MADKGPERGDGQRSQQVRRLLDALDSLDYLIEHLKSNSNRSASSTDIYWASVARTNVGSTFRALAIELVDELGHEQS